MKPRLLDLFCGAGGASMGYHRAGFEVEGVDIKPQPHYPFKFYQADALEFPLEGYDAYHASPPCQAYSLTTNRQPLRKTEDARTNHPDLIGKTRELLLETSKPLVIENVVGARNKLNQPFLLCGTMFGLRFFKHRLFESNVFLLAPKHAKHNGKVGDGYYVSPIGNTYKKIGLVEDWREAMQIDWMTVKELSEAIPPAYTEYIGLHLKRYLESSTRSNR
jgi:DNA (cytosine-5)-methyltransferase 1